MNDDFHKQPTLPGMIPEEKSTKPYEDAPAEIGPYKIECLLERGGMSILYLGTHPESQEPTTIKVLLPKFLSHTDIVNRFLKEAEIIAMADHPNIVKMYGHGEWEGGLYIAMEFIMGISLRQYILQNPMSLKRALEIILDIAYALCHLHTHGVIHRDLKPENILVTESGGIKVIDFGIAQLLTERKGEAPAHPRTIGTPIYMSPEQRENPEAVSYPSDIYSLGIIAYELVLGKLSHGQIHLSLMPKGLQKILNKALQPKPEDRYQDVVDFITDVTAYLNSANLQKEKKVGDQLSELSENLRQAQVILAPNRAPLWPGMEIGFASCKGVELVGAYCDFIEISSTTFAIILGESSAKGAEAIVYTAILRGMVRSLCQKPLNPKDLAFSLNRLLVKDTLDQVFTLSCWVISAEEQLFRFLSCGYGSLWHILPGMDTPSMILSDNMGLGIQENAEFHEITRFWQEGDTYILTGVSPNLQQTPRDHGMTETFMRQALLENAGNPPQKQVEGILRKIKLAFSRTPLRSCFLISIHF